VPIGMTRADDGLVIYESPASKELYRRTGSVGAVFGRDTFADPVDREAYLEILRSEGAIDDFNVTLKRKDGSTFPAQLSARLTEFDGEEVIVFSSTDLTRQNEIEAEMVLQREALHQSEKLSALGELLAGIAHELNNPLSVLVGQALLLRETVNDPTIKSRAEKIGNAADRCARIVKTFLAMARQEPAKTRRVDLREVIESALEFTGYALRGSNIEVQLRIKDDLPPIYADAAQIQQVLVNLIVNAQHALDERQRDGERILKIIASYRERDNEVLLKVKDNGPGMPDHVRRRIFEPLFTTKGIGSGTGIGLALCHRIVNTHGGKMKVESVEDVGTSFVIRFPASTAILPAEEAAEAPCEATASGRALVIDDEPDVGELIAEILRREGFLVDVAVSGADALKLLAVDSYDVILSDLRMPGFNGRDLYQQLHDDTPGLVDRLGFITGDTVSAKARDFLKATGRPFLEKPISPKEVRRLLAKMADSGPT
jgi:signal transduction histidine kinase/CheY-like chemotaxis protein